MNSREFKRWMRQMAVGAPAPLEKERVKPEPAPTLKNWTGLNSRAQYTSTKIMPIDHVLGELDRLQAIYEAYTEGLVVLQDEQCIFMNTQAAKLLRMTRGEVSADGLIRNLHPDDQAWYIARQEQRRAGKVVPNQFELRVIGQNGWEWVLFVAEISVVCAYGNTTMVYLSGTGHQLEPESEEVRAKIEGTGTLRESWSGMAYSVNGTYIWVNAAFARRVGYTREALIGKPLTMLCADIELRDQRESLAAAGTSTTLQHLRRSNGEPLHVQIKGQCVHRNDPDAGVIWTLLDTANALRQGRPPSQSVNSADQPHTSDVREMQSNLAVEINHEIRTPLTTILSSAELLKAYGNRISHAKTIEMLETIEQSVHRITKAIDQTLKVTNGQLQQQMKEANRQQDPGLRGRC